MLEPPILMLELALPDPGEDDPAWAKGGVPTTAEIMDPLPKLRSTTHTRLSKDKATEPKTASLGKAHLSQKGLLIG